MGYYVQVVETKKFLAKGREVEKGAATFYRNFSSAQRGKDEYEAKTGKQCTILSWAQAEKY